MKVCKVKLKSGETCTFRGAIGEEDGFSVIVYEDVDLDKDPNALSRFGLPDVSSWWNKEETPPEEGKRVDPDPDPFA